MQRPPKRPSSSFSNTDSLLPAPSYARSSPHLTTHFEEESDTSRRVKFRSPLIQDDNEHQRRSMGYNTYQQNDQPQYQEDVGRDNEYIQTHASDYGEQDEDTRYDLDPAQMQSQYVQEGNVEPHENDYIPRPQSQDHNHQQPYQEGYQQNSDSNQAQYTSYNEGTNSLSTPHMNHPQQQSRHLNQPYQPQPPYNPTNNLPLFDTFTQSSYINQHIPPIPETYTIPQRSSKSQKPMTLHQQKQMDQNDFDKYLNQEGGMDSNGDIKVNHALIENWTQTEDTEGMGKTGEGGGTTGESGSEEDGGKKKRILALHAPYGGDIAAAWWDPEKRKIEILEDTKDTMGWDLALLVIEQAQPDLIVMSSQTSQTLLDRAQTWDEENRADDADEKQSRLRLLPYKQCTQHSAMAHLASLRLPNQSKVVQLQRPVPSSTSDTTTSAAPGQNWAEDSTGMGVYRLNLVKLGCWVDVNAPLAIIATGILVSEIKEGTSQWILELGSIESMEIERHMQINRDALTSLAIFDVEAHAFIHAKNQKQALSVFGLLDTCVTPLGKKLFHTWHLRPLANLNQIEARHEAVSLLSANHNTFTKGEILKLMKRIKNLPIIFTKMRSGTAKFADWRAMHDSFEAIMDVRDHALNMAWHKPVEILDKIRTNISQEIGTMERTMNRFIDWDTSKGQARMAIKPGINSELDDLKELYAGLDNLLNEVAIRLRDDIPPGTAQDFSVIYLPQIGFHSVIVTPEEQSNPPKIPGWIARFMTTDKHYYKNQAMIDLDAHYGDIYVNMTSLEIDILQDVTEQLQQRESLILSAVDVIAELDCLLALAKAVPKFDLRRPLMTNDNTLKIRGGRHILYEQVCTTYVANDIILEGGKDAENHNMMIVTGANGSGKSAYGKQVAVIVFMAQMGSFVPAEEAVIGICDKIYTRLQTKESSSKHASAFMIDLGQVSQALRGATEKSLIILDEFGKGTITWDGAGLLAGVVEYLQKGPCPRTVVLTHFHELITQRFLEEDDGIMFAHMRTLMVPRSNELHYMFKLAPGPSHSSYAAQCALQHNIPKDVVERAQFVTGCISNFELHKLYDTELTSRQEEELRANEELAKLFMSWNIDEDTQDIREIAENMLEDTDVDSLTRTTYITGEGGSGEERSVELNEDKDGDGDLDRGERRRKVVNVADDHDEVDELDVKDGISVDPSDSE